MLALPESRMPLIEPTGHYQCILLCWPTQMYISLRYFDIVKFLATGLFFRSCEKRMASFEMMAAR